MFELLMVGRKEHDNDITVLLTCLNTRYMNHGSLTNLKNFDSLIVEDINVPVELCETEFSIKYRPNASHDCKLFQPALHFSPPSTSMIDIRLCDDITCNLLKRNTRWSDRSMFLVWMWRLRFSKRWRSVSKQQNLFFLKSPLTEGLFSIEAARLVVRKAEKRPSGYNIGQLGRGYIKQ